MLVPNERLDEDVVIRGVRAVLIFDWWNYHTKFKMMDVVFLLENLQLVSNKKTILLFFALKARQTDRTDAETWHEPSKRHENY